MGGDTQKGIDSTNSKEEEASATDKMNKRPDKEENAPLAEERVAFCDRTEQGAKCKVEVLEGDMGQQGNRGQCGKLLSKDWNSVFKFF